MRKLVLLALLLLTSCMTREERIAAQEAKDDQKCLSFGAQKGSDAYVNCRTQLSAARSMAPAPRGSVICNTTGTTTICN
jgi:hypothetical protein